MSLVALIVVGLIAGFIASKIINKSDEGLALDLALGVAGAGIAGWLFNTFATADGSSFSVYGVIAAIVGAVALQFVYRAFYRRARFPL
jgi:uncharacterized membrane protein YeaQ/YmgE (transglycosylase-associated protein family)